MRMARSSDAAAASRSPLLAWFSACPSSATTAGDVEVDSDGSFRIGGLEDGVYKLSVYCYASESDKARGRLFRNQVVEDVSAGTADVEIRLERKR